MPKKLLKKSTSELFLLNNEYIVNVKFAPSLLKSAQGSIKPIAGLYMSNMKFEGYSGPLTFACLGYLFFVLSALFIIIAFLMTIILCKKPKTKAMVGLDIVSILFSLAAFSEASRFFSLSISFCLSFSSFAALRASLSSSRVSSLLAGALATAILMPVATSKSTTATKDEKERQKEIEREKNREASEKAAKEEEKKRVEEAKAKLAAKAAKRKK